MTRETKVGLLVGMGVILLIGIIVSDHLSMAQKQTPPDMTDYGSIAQNSLNAQGTGLQSLPTTSSPTTPAAPANPLPTPDQFQSHNAVAQQTPTYGAPAPASDNTSNGQMPTPVARTGQDAVADALNAHLQQQQATSQNNSQNNSQNSPAANTATARQQIANAIDRANPDFDTAALASRVAVIERPVQGPQPYIHYVQNGETLYAIALRYYNNGELWHIISQANPSTVRSDNTVNLGARLIIPNKALLPDLLQRNPQAATVLAPAAPVASIVSSSPRTVVVKPGDTLSGLASEHMGTSRKWKELLDANKDKMDSPQDLRVGMTINIPSSSSAAQSAVQTVAPAVAVTTANRVSSGGNVYTVQPGDTLSRIAESRMGDGNLWDAIYQANRDQLKNANDLAPGMKIKIPVQR